MDEEGTGFLDAESVQSGLNKSGVFLSQADIDALLKMVPRNPLGHLNYMMLLDSIIGKSKIQFWDIPFIARDKCLEENQFSHSVLHLLLDGPSETSSARPHVNTEFVWPDGETVVVGLKLHEKTSKPYVIPSSAMQRLVLFF